METGNVLRFPAYNTLIISVSNLHCCIEPPVMIEELTVPDGATEQERVLEDNGQARPEGLQRQLGDVNVVNHNPPC